MERRRLSPAEIEEGLRQLDGWEERNSSLSKRFKFGNFAGALEFVNKAGDLAEAADHHPDIRLGWGYAEFEITTHDRGGITDLDLDLARKIDAIE